MRAAAILGLGCSLKNLKAFQTDATIGWRIGLPAAEDQADIVLLFGGDGTIHRYLDELVQLRRPVLIVPAGGGNDFARALGLRSIRDSLTAWRRFCAKERNVREVDLGVITSFESAESFPSLDACRNSALGTRHYFCSIAGIGLDCEVARSVNGLPRWLRGHGGYALSLAPALLRFTRVPMKIFTSDGSGSWIIRSDQPTTLAAFANTSSYGGGMKIAPHAQLDDGRLDVCVIGSIHRLKLACMFPTVYFGRHLRIRKVEYFGAERVRVQTESSFDVYADGEFVCRTPVEVSLQRRALKVLTL